MDTQRSLRLVNPAGKLAVSPPYETGFKNLLEFNDFVSPNNKCLGFSWNFDGSLLFALDQFRNLSCFNIKHKRYSVIAKAKFDLPLITIKSAKEYLCLIDEGRIIRVLSIPDHKIVHSLPGHKLKIRALRFNPIQNIMLSLSADCLILWDVPTFKNIKSIFLEKPFFTNAIFSEDGLSILALLKDNAVNIYDVGNYQMTSSYKVPTSANLTCFACCNESKTHIFGGNVPCFLIYDLEHQLTREQAFNTMNFSVMEMKLSHNNYLLACHDEGKEVVVYDISNEFKVVGTFNLPDNLAIKAFSFDFENKNLGFLSNLGGVFIYDFKVWIEKLKRKPLKSSAEITFSLTTVSPNINTILTEQVEKPSEILPNKIPKASTRRSPHSQESIEILKENVSIGYLNNSLLEGKPHNKSSKLPHRRPQSSGVPAIVSHENLLKYLRANNSFPEKNRLFIWKTLLDLPENKEAFNNLVRKGICPQFHDLYKRFQLTSENLFRKLQRILSVLCHYAPALLDVPFLPELIFPFVKLFQANELLCFEVVLSFLLNWFQHFFEFSPKPPLNFFKAVNEVLRLEDAGFWAFLQERGVSSVFLLWPSLQVLFTNVLEKQEWLNLMDFLVMNREKPEYLVHFSASLLLSLKGKIMASKDGILPLEVYEGGWQMGKITKSIERLDSKLPFDFPLLKYKQCLPLTREQYPIFDFYPVFDLDHHKKQRLKIVEEERRFLEERNRSTLEKIQAFSLDLIANQDNMRSEWLSFTRKIEDEKEIVKTEQELMLRRKAEIEGKGQIERIEKMERMENEFKRTISEQMRSRELERETIGRELEFNRKLEDLNLGTKIKDEALNKRHFELVMKMNEILKQREMMEEEKNSKQKMEFFNTLQFYENNLKEEEIRKEKTLNLLRQDLEIKKQTVEENMRNELELKKSQNDKFFMERMGKDMKNTYQSILDEMQNELEKEKMLTGKVLTMRKQLGVSQNGRSGRLGGMIRRNKEREDLDEEMENFKMNAREEMTRNHFD